MKKQGLLGTTGSRVEKNYQNLMLAMKMFSPNRDYLQVNQL
jgi:hypothetical protein